MYVGTGMQYMYVCMYVCVGNPFAPLWANQLLYLGPHKQIVKRSSKLLAHANHAQKPVQRQLVATMPQIHQDASNHSKAETKKKKQKKSNMMLMMMLMLWQRRQDKR